MIIADITDREISALTRTLQLLPDENAVSYAGRVMSSISVLDSHLKRPNKVSALILPSQKIHTPFCKLHKPLNATIVHALFNLVALEAGGRLNSLVSNNHKLTETERARVQSLRKLHSLWLEPEVYQKTFFELPDSVKWKYQDDECEACMLARIGGDMPVLLNLRMALLSRMSRKKLKHHGPPRLMRWIERWIASLSGGLIFSSEQFEDMISQNDQDGIALKEIRKQLWYERRESCRAFDANKQKQNRRSTQLLDGDISTPSQPTIRVSADTTNTSDQTRVSDRDESDTESYTDDPYRVLTSTAYLPSIASTLSLPHQPAKYVHKDYLTTHNNTNIHKLPIPTTRPPPTDFYAADIQDRSKKLYRSESQGHRSASKPLRRLKDPSSRTSHYDSKAISPADSYIPPPFNVHPAYILPTAAGYAKRYQNLLSPHPATRESEEELRIPETPGLPVRPEKRVSPLVELPVHILGLSGETGRMSTFTTKEADEWPSINGSSVSISAVSRSKTMREPSRWRSVSPSSVYSEYREGKPLPPRPVETDWYANRGRSNVSRAKSSREHSTASTVSSSSYHGTGSSRRSRSRRDSGETNVTRMSDLFAALMDDMKGESQ